jgi:hypothetical protein
MGVLLPQALASPAEVVSRDAFREQGYVEGQNIVIECRRIGGSVEDARPHAAELVRSKGPCYARRRRRRAFYADTGSVTSTSRPPETRLHNTMSPPWLRITARAEVSPSPTPPVERLREASKR